MSNPTFNFFRRQRKGMKRRNDMPDDEAFRLWLRALFKDNPEIVSDAVADFVAERIERESKREAEHTIK